MRTTKPTSTAITVELAKQLEVAHGTAGRRAYARAYRDRVAVLAARRLVL